MRIGVLSLLFFSFSNDSFSQDYLENQLFIKFKSFERDYDKFAERIRISYGFRSVDKAFRLQELKEIYLVELKSSDTSSIEEIIKSLSKIGEIEYAEKIPIYKLFFTPNDPQYSSQWNLAKIQADQAWNLSQGCSGIKIAVTDDGFLMSHQDLSNQWYINAGETPGNGVDDDGNGYIDDWRGWDAADIDNDPSAISPTNSAWTHGTHVAGIVAGQTNNSQGVASIGYNCKIIPVKNTNNSPWVTHGYKAVEYAIAAGADVINMSWGGNGSSSTYQNIFNLAYSKGIMCIAAAGNSSTSSGMFPASYNHVISVASTTTTDALSSFSNFGATIDVCAPGSNILSTLAGGISSYGSMSGTSMASPLVAGLCGLMKCYNPQPIDSIEACLKRTCDNINSMNPTRTGQIGAGRVNAYQALQCMTTKPKSMFSTKQIVQCVNQPVEFFAQSYGVPTLTYKWTFPGGSPSSSTIMNPTVSYSSIGTYSASLITCNSLGCDTILKSNIVKIDTPRASLKTEIINLVGQVGSVILKINFSGNPPYSIGLNNGIATTTYSNIRQNPYFLQVAVSKDTTHFVLTSFSDSSCIGLYSGLTKVYRKTPKHDTTICITLRTSDVGAIDGTGLSSASTTNINWNFSVYDNIVANWTVSGSPHFWKNILKFNLSGIPSNATINSANLSLFSNPSSIYGWTGQPTAGSNNSSYIRRITNTWSPSSLSTSAWPNTTASNEVILAQSPNTNYNYNNIGIKNLVIDQIQNGNNGLFHSHVNTPYYNSLIYYSAEETDSTKHPSLVICYTIPGSDGPPPPSTQVCESSFKFDGTNTSSVVDINPGTGKAWKDLYSTNGFTWECWFNLGNRSSASVTGVEAIVGASDAVIAEDIGLFFNWPNAGSGKINFVVSGQPYTSAWNVASSNMSFTANTWYHAAGVCDYTNNIIRLYINGTQVASASLTLSMSQRLQNAVAVTIGNQDRTYNPHASNMGFNGKIDEVRFWNTVRTPSEIQNSLKICLPSNTSNLVAYFKADEGSGTNTVSKMNSDFTGTLKNSTTWGTQVDSMGNCNFCDSDCDTTNLNTGLVLNLPFNGNTNDISGNANHATNYGATSIAGKSGVANTAYRFDSMNYMSINHNSILNLRSFSITAILKPLKFNTNLCYGNCILAKGANGAPGQWAFIYGPADNGSTCYNRDTNLNNFLFCGNTCNASWYIPDTPYMKYNQWNCVVTTYDSLSKFANMYVDGKLRHQWITTWDLLTSSNTMDMLIGKFAGTGYPYFIRAVIDDIRIYNRVLAPAEVKGYCGTCNFAETMPTLKDNLCKNDSLKLYTDTVNWTVLANSLSKPNNVKATLLTYQYNSNSLVPAAKWISCQPAWIINGTNGNPPDTMLMRYKFKTLKADSVRFDFTFYRDNYGKILLDGTYLLEADAVGANSANYNGTQVFKTYYLSPGVHTLDFTIYNHYNFNGANGYGFMAAGYISSKRIINCDSIKCDTSKKFTYSKCTNDSTQLNLRAGSNYQWSPVTGLTSDTIRNPKCFVKSNTAYVVAHLDTNGCQLVDTIQVNVKTPANYWSILDQIICNGDSAQVSIPVYATSIQWSPNTNISNTTAKSPYLFPSATTTYYLKFTDSFGCDQYDTVNVIVKTCCAARARFDLSDSLICYGQNVSITNKCKGPISSYSWNFSNASPSSYNAANPPILSFPNGNTYPIRLIVSNGTCFDTMTKNVYVIQFKPYAGRDSIDCLSSLKVKLGDDPISTWTYSWTPTTYLNDPTSSNPIAIIPNATVRYIVEAQEMSTGCKFTDTVHISNTFDGNIINQSKSICIGDSFKFFDSFYKKQDTIQHKLKKWNSSCDSIEYNLFLIVINPTTRVYNSIYYCNQYRDKYGLIWKNDVNLMDTVKSSIGCDSIYTTTPIKVIPRKDTFSNLSACEKIFLKGKWHYTTKNKVDSFILKSILSNCDSIVTYYNIAIYPNPNAKITASKPNPIKYKDSVVLTASGGTQYLWLHNFSTDIAITYKALDTSSVVYTVKATDPITKCWDTSSYKIYVLLPDSCSVGIPNSFSPNGDNVNDVFIPNFDICANIVSFRIYDRWGEKLFETNKYEGWDGKFKGDYMPIGVYVYYLEITTRTGKHIYKNTFNLFR